MNVTKTANSITFEFDEIEQQIVANDVLDPLVWIEQAVTNKIANCKRRLLDSWIKKFQQTKSVENIPTDEDEMIALIFSQPDYRCRVEQDAKEKKTLGI